MTTIYADTTSIKFSSKVRAKWFWTIILWLFLVYVPASTFIEDYFYFRINITFAFYWLLIFLIFSFCSILLLFVQFFKKSALVVSERGITLRYSALGNLFLPFLNIEHVYCGVRKKKKYVSFTLHDRKTLLGNIKNPVQRYLWLAYLDKEHKELLIPAADLAVNADELVLWLMQLSTRDTRTPA